VGANEGLTCAGILEQSMGARNRIGKGLSYPPARLERPAESVPWNRFLGSLKFVKYRLWSAHVFLNVYGA
jgi:hypothetical protein